MTTTGPHPFDPEADAQLDLIFTPCKDCGLPRSAAVHQIVRPSISEQALRLAAEALVQYETSGTCKLGQACGLCDCGADSLTAEHVAEIVAREIDRARHTVDGALNEELVAKTLHYIRSSTPWDELNPGQKVAARSDARVFRGAILGRKPTPNLGDQAAQTLARYGATPRLRKRDRS